MTTSCSLDRSILIHFKPNTRAPAIPTMHRTSGRSNRNGFARESVPQNCLEHLRLRRFSPQAKTNHSRIRIRRLQQGNKMALSISTTKRCGSTTGLIACERSTSRDRGPDLVASALRWLKPWTGRCGIALVHPICCFTQFDCHLGGTAIT